MDYSNPPYKAESRLHKHCARGPYVRTKRYNKLVREYNELLDDIDMILRAWQLYKSNQRD